MLKRHRLLRKTPYRKNRSVERNRIHDHIHPRTIIIRKPRVYDRSLFIYHPVAPAHNLLDHILQPLSRSKMTFPGIESPSLLIKDMTIPVHHNLRDLRIIHQLLQDIQLADRIEKRFVQLFLLGQRHRGRR